MIVESSPIPDAESALAAAIKEVEKRIAAGEKIDWTARAQILESKSERHLAEHSAAAKPSTGAARKKPIGKFAPGET